MRRDRVETVFDILEVIRKQPSIATHVMYKANVNMAVLSPMLDFLVREELIMLNPKDRRGGKVQTLTPLHNRPYYSVTPKGVGLINTYHGLLDFIRRINDE